MFEDVRQEIDRKVEAVARMPAGQDPALAPWANQVAALVRGLQAFEGHLIARVLPAALHDAPHLHVVAQPRVVLPQRALEAVAQGVDDVALEYTDDDGPVRRLDLVVFHCRTGVIEFVECKRGTAGIGRDHQRARLRDDAALELIGRDYARTQFRQLATAARAVTLSYYGATGLPEHRTLRAAELNNHYEWNVREVVETHLRYFRARLDAEIPGLTGVAA